MTKRSWWSLIPWGSNPVLHTVYRVQHAKTKHGWYSSLCFAISFNHTDERQPLPEQDPLLKENKKLSYFTLHPKRRYCFKDLEQVHKWFPWEVLEQSYDLDVKVFRIVFEGKLAVGETQAIMIADRIHEEELISLESLAATCNDKKIKLYGPGEQQHE